tara:strand:- start:2706 stop:3026 length:321 start_codon:yes stop_codon:yes gene_type:complete
MASPDDSANPPPEHANEGEHDNGDIEDESAKPHVCDLCPSRFSRKSNLDPHKKTVHSGQMPFECPDCNHKFSRTDNLKQHIARIHANNDISRDLILEPGGTLFEDA